MAAQRPSAERRAPVFRGRTAERDRLARLLDQVRSGESAALVVRGEAGIGKTALLDQCAGMAAGFQVARIAGTQSEMELPFAALHLLCAPFLGKAEALPDPQRNALQVAFGLLSGDPPDRFLVGLATLGLLAEVAQKRPLLCVVDDAQWLDAASGQVLGFVARRLLAESVLMLFAVREATEDRHVAGLAELRVSGLADDDARALLVAATLGPVDPRVQDRMVAESRGNPLALLELPRGMSAADLAGGFAVPRSGGLPGQLEEHFLRRFEALPEGAQRLVLVAAADPTGDVALLRRAARVLGIANNNATDAAAEALVEIGARVQFRHPLVRSAIYSGASLEDRQAVHLALAAATDAQTDPDRRAWHRALAAAEADEEVASELERSAVRAQARGGLAAAAAFLQRSVTLTEDPAHRADRALAAAQAHIYGGAFSEALSVLSVAESDAQYELQRARTDLLRGQMAAAAGPITEASRRLFKAARRLEPLDASLARETYLDALATAMFAGPFGPSGQLRDISQAALAAPAPLGPPRVFDLLLEGLSLVVTEGVMVGAPSLRRAIDLFPGEELSVDRGLQWGQLASLTALMLFDFESTTEIISHQSERARRNGALAPLCFTLNSDVFVAAWRGDLADAVALAAEAADLTDMVGVRQSAMGAMIAAALSGNEPHSSTFIEAEIDLARSRGEGLAVQTGLWAAAVLNNGLGRYDRVVAPSLRLSEEEFEFFVFVTPWALLELIEAAVRTSDRALAVATLGRLAEVTELNGSAWARAALARSKALVSDDETAEEYYRESSAHFGRTSMRPEHARAHLLYGEWLRRQNRRIDARDELRQAYDMFSEMGMLAFAQRALHELQATGETVRKRRDDTRHDLTPQEEHIARLALEGRTNPEIGAQLYISARTVEWHLRKVFTKLNVTSRRELRNALPTRLGTRKEK